MSTDEGKGKWHGPWCTYFASLLDERKLNPTDFSLLVNDLQNNIWQYLNGLIRPPLNKIDLFAKKLKLDEAERAKFIRLARLAHSPDAVQDELGSLRADNAALRAQLHTICNHLRQLGIDPDSLTDGRPG